MKPREKRSFNPGGMRQKLVLASLKARDTKVTVCMVRTVLQQSQRQGKKENAK